MAISTKVGETPQRALSLLDTESLRVYQEQLPQVTWHQFADPQKSVPVPKHLSMLGSSTSYEVSKILALTTVVTATAAQTSCTFLVHNGTTSLPVLGNTWGGCWVRRLSLVGFTVAVTWLAACAAVKSLVFNLCIVRPRQQCGARCASCVSLIWYGIEMRLRTLFFGPARDVAD